MKHLSLSLFLSHKSVKWDKKCVPFYWFFPWNSSFPQKVFGFVFHGNARAHCSLICMAFWSLRNKLCAQLTMVTIVTSMTGFSGLTASSLGLSGIVNWLTLIWTNSKFDPQIKVRFTVQARGARLDTINWGDLCKNSIRNIWSNLKFSLIIFDFERRICMVHSALPHHP